MERSEIREDGPGFRCAPSGLRSHIAPPQGRIPCKQQRIYNPFTSVVARPGATRASTNEKSRSEAAHPVALSVARHMRPSCKARHGGRRAQSNCGFSPIIFSPNGQTERCQESCHCVRARLVMPGLVLGIHDLTAKHEGK